ncbi:MAG: hypothetical protein KDK97_15055, partial [Verrucomicrobiales bacterium]|nr:hypothetical protein [Verrucomicrobiales bacterium]
LANVAIPEGIQFDGENVAPVITGKSEVSRKAPIFWRRPPDRKNWLPHIVEEMPDLAVRDGEWKFLCEYDGSQPRLYNVNTDQAESVNVAAQNPEVVNRLTAEVQAWNSSVPPDNGPILPAQKSLPKGKGKGKAEK